MSKVVIIKNADKPAIAEFIEENGRNKLFSSFEDADDWLWKHAEPGVSYQCFDGN